MISVVDSADGGQAVPDGRRHHHAGLQPVCNLKHPGQIVDVHVISLIGRLQTLCLFIAVHGIHPKAVPLRRPDGKNRFFICSDYQCPFHHFLSSSILQMLPPHRMCSPS